jgi:hypothetical protein
MRNFLRGTQKHMHLNTKYKIQLDGSLVVLSAGWNHYLVITRIFTGANRRSGHGIYPPYKYRNEWAIPSPIFMY